MNATTAQAADAATAVPLEEAAAAAADADDLVRAWTRLLGLELLLARRSLRWMLVGAVTAPVIGLGAWLGLSALLVIVAQAYTQEWVLAALLGVGVQLLALATLLRQLRRWARDLTLPQSRAALTRAMEKMT